MRQVYAHEAVLIPGPGSGPALPVGCAHTTRPDGDRVRLRILFAAEPRRVDEVRARVDAALATGGWRLVSSGCSRLAPDERPQARRLLKSG